MVILAMVDWKRHLTRKLLIFFKYFRFWLGGAGPQPSRFLAGGAKPPPLNGRSSHLIEAAKRGRLDQMIFFSAPLTTRAPPTTVRRPSDDRPPAVRQPSTVPMILRYLGANLRAGANFKNLPLNCHEKFVRDFFFTKKSIVLS